MTRPQITLCAVAWSLAMLGVLGYALYRLFRIVWDETKRRVEIMRREGR